MNKVLKMKNLSDSTGLALLIARVGVAALMLTHGIPKLGMLLAGDPIKFPSVWGMGAEFSLVLAVLAEVVGSVLILVGFATRLAAIPLILTMLVAVFIFHAADPFAVKEPALQYLLVYVVLLLTGSGKYSMDYLFRTKAVKSNLAKVEEQQTAFSISK
jgi:putative oxidoreductase